MQSAWQARGCEPPRRGDQPVPAPARRQPGRLVPLGRRGADPRAGGGPADPALDRLRRLPLVPRDGARVLRGRVDRGCDERALRQRQGRPRGAPRPRRCLHGSGGCPVGPRRLADDRLPDACGRAFLRRHVLPARAAARDAQLPSGARLDRGGVARPSRRRLARRGATGRGGAPFGRAATVARPAHGVRARRRRAQPGRDLRARLRGLGEGAQVPERSHARVPAPPGRGGGSRDGGEDAGRHGRRRDVRPARRWLPPLLGRRPVAGAALREDALRQRAPGGGIPARLARDRHRPLPRDRERDDRLHAPRAPSARERARLGPGRRHRRRRGPDLHLD